MKNLIVICLLAAIGAVLVIEKANAESVSLAVGVAQSVHTTY